MRRLTLLLLTLAATQAGADPNMPGTDRITYFGYEVGTYRPREDIPPGGEASFTEDWWLLPYTYPRDGSDLDLEAISALVEREAR